MTPKKIAILTDSCADLSPDLAQANRIFTVPLRILCEDGEYACGVDITTEQVFARLKKGELPKTSLPSGAAFADAFRQIHRQGYDGVIAVMLSGGISGTYSMACVAAQDAPVPVRVYDSRNASLGLGLTVLQLARDLRAGMDWDTLTGGRVEYLIDHTHTFLSVDTLEYLYKGGRIGKVTAVAGSILGIKPVLGFAEDGELESVAKARGREKVMDKLLEHIIRAKGNARRYSLAAANAAAAERMEQLCARMAEAMPDYEQFVTCSIGPTIGVYTGEGLLGGAVQILE